MPSTRNAYTKTNIASASYLTCSEDSVGYRYGFNSMPKENELYGSEGSAYDFGARIYDSRLGRWMATDALANINPGSSPFRYAKNSPLLYLDEGGYFDIKVTKAAREKFGITKQQLKRMDQVLRAMPTYLKDNPQVVAIVSKQTGLSPEQIMADAEYGKGPVILVDFTPETQRKSMFVSREDYRNNTMSFDGSIVKWFEEKEFSNDDELVGVYMGMFGAVCHGYGHLGDRKTNNGDITSQGTQNVIDNGSPPNGKQGNPSSDRVGNHRGALIGGVMYGFSVSNTFNVLEDGTKSWRF